MKDGSLRRVSSTRENRTRTTYQSSLAMPRSLQHRIRALLLQPSVAVGSPD